MSLFSIKVLLFTPLNEGFKQEHKLKAGAEHQPLSFFASSKLNGWQSPVLLICKL
jgi:hypothetical protein